MSSQRAAVGRAAAGIAGAAALIAVITVVSRVVGFGRWVAQSAAVGQSCVGTAYATANQLPNVLFEVVAGGALAAAVVPVLAGPLARGVSGRREVDQISSALLTWTVAVLAPVALLLALGARPLVGWLLDEGCDGQNALAVRMLLVFAPQVVLYGVGIVLTGVLQAQRRFLWPAAVPLASSAVVIAAYAVFHELAQGRQQAADALPGAAEAWLAWGTTAGVVAMTLPLLLPVRRSGVRLRPTFRFPPGVARRAAALAGAGVLTLVAQQLSVVAVLRLAGSGGPTGTINVFQYTQAVYLLPYAVLAVPLATSAFPALARSAATGDLAGFARTCALTTRAVVLVALAGAAVLVAAAAPVEAFFAGIDATGRAPWMAPALLLMAPGLVGFALVAHLGRALNALERGRLAAQATSAGWLVVAAGSVVAVLLLPREETVVGLAVGSAVGMTVAGALLVLAVRHAAGRDALHGLARTAFGSGGATTLAAAAGWWVGHRLTQLGDGALPAVGAAAGAAAVALAVLAIGVVLLDRGTADAARRLVSRRRAPATTDEEAAR